MKYLFQTRKYQKINAYLDSPMENEPKQWVGKQDFSKTKLQENKSSSNLKMFNHFTGIFKEIFSSISGADEISKYCHLLLWSYKAKKTSLVKRAIYVQCNGTCLHHQILSHFALRDTIKTNYFINISDELKRTKSIAKVRSITATYPHLY